MGPVSARQPRTFVFDKARTCVLLLMLLLLWSHCLYRCRCMLKQPLQGPLEASKAHTLAPPPAASAPQVLPQPSQLVLVTLPRPLGLEFEEDARRRRAVVAGFTPGARGRQDAVWRFARGACKQRQDEPRRMRLPLTSFCPCTCLTRAAQAATRSSACGRPS